MRFELPSVERLDVGGKRVLLRADLNVPLADGRVADDFRVRTLLPTLEHLLDRDARVIACSHLGRPKGVDERFRMQPVAELLGRLIGREVEVAPEVVGPRATGAARSLPSGGVLLLENLRFEPGETRNDPELAAALAGLAECYVNDAFGASHRAHASIVGVPALLPSAAGFLLGEEVRTLTALLEDSPRPFVCVLGGAKVSDKLGVVRNLLARADRILIGGGMCFTFLKARGVDVGGSLVDEERLGDVRGLLADAGDRIMLPWDVVVAESPDSTAGTIVALDEIPADQMGLDIGPGSAEGFSKVVTEAGSVFWNGPLGVFENKAFQVGTRMVAQAVAACDGFTVAGGGDTAAALDAFGFADEVDFMSTGGGASLEMLEGRTLPGIQALLDASRR